MHTRVVSRNPQMDKDRVAAAPCSWMEMHSFIGDLMAASTSVCGHPPRASAQEALTSAWDMTRPKVSHSLQSSLSRQIQKKSLVDTSLSMEEKGLEERREIEGQVVHHICTCPGCPLSSSLQNMKATSSSASQIEPSSSPPEQTKNRSSASVSLGVCIGLGLSLEDDGGEATNSSSSELGQRQQEDKGTGTHSPAPNTSLSTSPVQAFPCLCCHRGIQTCSSFLRQQKELEGNNAHLHYHHHHCSLTSCITGVQLHHASQSLPSFPCLSCHRTFPTCSQLLRHQQGHAQQEGPQQLPCMHCSESFPRPSQLLQHQRTQHASKAGGFLCPECGRTFNSHSNLRIHLNVHTGARPYVCAECGKSFSQSGALKIHCRIHTGEKPYTCSYCGRGFPHLAGVTAHQRIHTGEKPYRCELCGKSFTQSGALKIHIRIHTGERPFACSLCGKSFASRSGIRFHYRTVHGIVTEPNSVGRPSLAPALPSTLSDLHKLQASVMNQPADDSSPPGKLQAGLPYACEDCGRRFADAPSRNRHQTSEHYSRVEGEDGEGGSEKDQHCSFS